MKHYKLTNAFPNSASGTRGREGGEVIILPNHPNAVPWSEHKLLNHPKVVDQ